MKSDILYRKPDYENFINEYSEHVTKLETESAVSLIKNQVKYYNKKSNFNPLQYLEDRWFDALERGEIDYSVYSDFNYFAEVWACWQIYSREYIKLVDKNKEVLFEGDITKVLDLGNGIGRSTAALTDIFPYANVYGTNLKESDQWKLCQYYGDKYGFSLYEDSSELGNIDIVIAFEYFEHIHEPIKHLQDIIDNNSPRYFVINNSFGTVGIGHFKSYHYDNTMIDWKKMGRIFIKAMHLNGYERSPIKFFNNAPSVWIKKVNTLGI